MTVKRFPEEIKDDICRAYSHKTLNLTELSKVFNTSSRTIGRILEERGLATPVPRLKGEAYTVMQILAKHNINAEQLERVLATPSLTPASVQRYLNQSSKQELATFFYTSGLVKLAAIAQQVQANVQSQQQTDPVPVSATPGGAYGGVPYFGNAPRGH
jgi:hypothetical protein